MPKSKSCMSYLQWLNQLWMNMDLQSCHCRAMAKMRDHSHFRPRELRAGSLHQVGKVLEEMHKDDLKAMSFEKRDTCLIQDENKKSSKIW